MKKFTAILTFAALLFPVAAFAISYTGPVDMVGAALTQSTNLITNQLQSVALYLLFAFLVLQFTIDGYGHIIRGELEGWIGYVAKFFVWATVCVWLLSDAGNGLTNLGAFLRSSTDFFLGKASAWAGLNGGSFDAGDIIATGLVAYGNITAAVLKATATNVANTAATAAAAVIPGAAPALLFITSLMVFFVSLTIMLSCAYIAFKVFMVKLQIALVICAAPMSVALLGLKTFRDQGFAPIKSLMALIFKIIMLAAIVAALKTVSDNLSDTINNLSWGVAADIWTPLLAAMMGFVLLAFITHQSDGIVASLTSGSSGLSTGDMASSIAAGVSAGLTGGTVVAATQAAASGGAGIKAVGDVMKNMNDASPIARGAEAMRQSLGLDFSRHQQPGLSTTPTGNAMEKAARSVDPDKTIPDAAISAGVDAIGRGVSDSAVMGKMIDRGAHPKHLSAAIGAMKSAKSSSGDESTAGIGGADATPQKTDQEKMAETFQRLSGRASDLGRVAQQDNRETHVSMNTHSAHD